MKRSVAVVIAAIVIIILAGILWAYLEATSGCVSCLAYHSRPIQEGSDLIILVHYTKCMPSSCYVCGAREEDTVSVNISVTPFGDRQSFYEYRDITLEKNITLPGILTDSNKDRVFASVSYRGWRDAPCSQVILDSYL